LTQPVDPSTHQSAEYDEVVCAWLRSSAFDVVHIQHLGWHSLALLKLAKQAGARVVVTFHDFYHLCPTVKLLDAEGHYCASACTPGQADCTPEPMWPGHTFPHLRGGWVNTWREGAAQALAHADAFTAPHESVRATVLQHLALPPDKPFFVVPHGRDWARIQWWGQLPKRSQALQILVPGQLVKAKGLEVVQALAALDGGNRLHFHLLGGGGGFQLKPGPGLTVHGEYRPQDFSARVAEIRPHVGAVFSIWNETWCHTLTEMWACGLPVMAFDFPTVAARINATGAGWVWPMETTQALYQRILALDFMEISRRTARATALRPTLLQQTTLQMARCYAEEVYGWHT
jgi:glycosyltransferase involved in cell wall biosynthesis